jgi:hypothetical protein
VLPLISLETGKSEEMMTLMGEKSLATRFFPDEVADYEVMFRKMTKRLTGGHVKGYEVSTEEETESGRVVIKVRQNVA